MKIICVPPNFKLPIPADADLVTILFGYAANPNDASIGKSVFDTIKKAKMEPAPRAWDLLSIALSVIAADTSVRRDSSPDGWTREIDLQIAVIDPEFWSSQEDLLAQQLKFLTTDIWRFSFVEDGFQPTSPRNPILSPQGCVSLLSGGLDSFVGAIDLVYHRKDPYLVSQVSRGDKEKQVYFANQIDGGIPSLQLNHNADYSGENERSQRARSIIFLAYGVLLATTFWKYREGEHLKLYVCENGYISINPPLTVARIGSLSTKTTHPIFINLFQQLLNAAGLRVSIENPYQFKTKGEMLSSCMDQVFLEKNAHNTTSCGRFARNGYKHCGRCLPCLIRRSSFHAWGIEDRTEYVYDDLSRDDEDHARFDDVRAAAMAAVEAKTNGFNRLFRSSLNSVLMGDLSSYKDVVRRGLNEMAVFLKAVGVI